MLGAAFIVARRFDEAIAAVQAGIALDASYHFYYLGLAWALSGLRRQEEAVDAFRRATVMAPEMPMVMGGLGASLGLAGHREEALTIVGELHRGGPQGQVNALRLALVSAGLGEHDQAIRPVGASS